MFEAITIGRGHCGYCGKWDAVAILDAPHARPPAAVSVTATAAAGYCLGSTSGIDYFRFFHTAMGIALLSSGIGALNQYIERDLDRRMRRTEMRPLPAPARLAQGPPLPSRRARLLRGQLRIAPQLYGLPRRLGLPGMRRLRGVGLRLLRLPG